MNSGKVVIFERDKESAELIKTYYNGITPEICSKLLYYIRLAQREKESNDDELLTLGNEIQNWSERNYGSTIHTIESENPYYFWNTSNSNTGDCE